MPTDRPVTPIPPLPAHQKEVERKEMIPGRAFLRIIHDQRRNRHRYEVIEPVLEGHEQEALDFLRDTLVRTMDGRHVRNLQDSEQYLRDAVRAAIHDHDVRIDRVGTERIIYYIIRDFLGYGPIDIMMRDPMIEDISCDGPGIPVYLYHREFESIETSVVFPDDETLDAFVIRLAQRAGKHISIADPLLDATLPDGSRLQATLSREVTTRGSSFTIRRFRADPLTPVDLILFGTMSAEMAAYFWLAIEHGASLIYAGGTASGKTTSLNAVCQFIPPEKKIVSIEDTREIQLAHDNWIAGVTRTGFAGTSKIGEGTGTIDMYRLLEAALRQRPEYLLVGEVRGQEALTLFQAMATGHAVYSTMHADSVPSAVHRLEHPPISVPRMMLQTLNIMAVQTQIRRGGRVVRRVREVTEIAGFDNETQELLTNTVFRWDPRTDHHRYLGKSKIVEDYAEHHAIPLAQAEQELGRRVKVLRTMADRGIRDYQTVARITNAFYRDPKTTLARLQDEAYTWA